MGHIFLPLPYLFTIATPYRVGQKWGNGRPMVISINPQGGAKVTWQSDQSPTIPLYAQVAGWGIALVGALEDSEFK